MRIYWLDCLEKGALGMMARPKGNDWLEDEILKLKNKGIHSVVSLLEKSEIKELGLEQEEELCQKYTIEFLNFPISDRGVPQHKTDFQHLLKDIISRLNYDNTIVIHCRMGIGRTSLLVAFILKYLKLKDAHGVFDYLSEIRALQVPDTVEQKEWLINTHF